MPLRIVHAADCHLDAPCLSLDARVRARVRAAEREAFTGLCDLAIAREVDALVLAGDLFDGSSVRLATRMWLVNGASFTTADLLPGGLGWSAVSPP